MKDKKRYLIVIGLMILTSLNIFGQTKKLRDVGRYRFIPIKTEAPAPEVMKTMLEKYADDIERGFSLAGVPDLYLPFMDRLRQSAYSEGELAVGDTMEWMIFRSQGQIKIIHNLEWAGKEPLPIYSFSVLKEDRKYEIIMPKSCGNLSLQRVTSVSAPLPAGEQKPPPVLLPEEKPEERYQISKAKIYQDIVDLINEVDLYCSFSVWENEIPELKVTGAERESEKAMLSDSDIIYLNKGTDDGIESGQIFRVLRIEDHLPGYGPVAFGRGRARVQFATADKAVAVVEHACDDVRRGHYLVPFEAREGVAGKDLGFDVFPVEGDGVKGSLIYLQSDLKQIGSGHWAIIDLGSEKGVQVGQQLIIYRRLGDDTPVQILGNCVVIDVQTRTSTVKILSCRDIIEKGDLAMERPAR